VSKLSLDKNVFKKSVGLSEALKKAAAVLDVNISKLTPLDKLKETDYNLYLAYRTIIVNEYLPYLCIKHKEIHSSRFTRCLDYAAIESIPTELDGKIKQLKKQLEREEY